MIIEYKQSGEQTLGKRTGDTMEKPRPGGGGGSRR